LMELGPDVSAQVSTCNSSYHESHWTCAICLSYKGHHVPEWERVAFPLL
jgi:hypothetical protein